MGSLSTSSQKYLGAFDREVSALFALKELECSEGAEVAFKSFLKGTAFIGKNVALLAGE